MDDKVNTATSVSDCRPRLTVDSTISDSGLLGGVGGLMAPRARSQWSSRLHASR